MKSRPEELRERTKQFATRAIKLIRSLPRTDEGRMIGRQLLRSATSVAANYRVACRARSTPEFIARIGVVVEEADESLFWLELLVDIGIMKKERLFALIEEAAAIVSIFSASLQTAKSNLRARGRLARTITRSPDHTVTLYK